MHADLLGAASAGLYSGWFVACWTNHVTPLVAVSQQCVAASVHHLAWQSSPNMTTEA